MLSSNLQSLTSCFYGQKWQKNAVFRSWPDLQILLIGLKIFSLNNSSNLTNLQSSGKYAGRLSNVLEQWHYWQLIANSPVNPVMICDKKFTQSLFEPMYVKGVHVWNAQFLLTCKLILWFVGCNCGYVKQADENLKASANASNTMVVGSGDPQSPLLRFRFQKNSQSYQLIFWGELGWLNLKCIIPWIFELQVTAKKSWYYRHYTNSAIIGQYLSILADTDTKDSQSKTIEVILVMEISAEHSFLANIV